MTDNPVTALPETEQSLREVVFQALGEVSAPYWRASGEVFNSEEASRIGEDLLMKIKILLGVGEPHLGLVTNGQLSAELETRKRLGHFEVDYRTLEPSRALWYLVQEPWVGKESIWRHRDFPNVYSTDRGETWYNLDEPLDFEGNPKIYRNGDLIA